MMQIMTMIEVHHMSSVQQQRRRNNDDDKYNNDDDNEMTNALWNYSTCRPDEHKHDNNRCGDESCGINMLISENDDYGCGNVVEEEDNVKTSSTTLTILSSTSAPVIGMMWKRLRPSRRR